MSDNMSKDEYNIDHNKDITVLVNVPYDEIKVGQKISIDREVSQKDIELFAILSGDINPTHFDENDNLNKDHHDIVAHRMLCGALISKVLGTGLPGPGTVYSSQSLNFTKSVNVGDIITVTLVVLEKKEDLKVILKCECLNQDGEIVCHGISEVIAPNKKIIVDKPVLPRLEVIENGVLCRELIERAKKLENKLKVAVVYPCSLVALQGAVEGYTNDLIEPILVGPINAIKLLSEQYNINIDLRQVVAWKGCSPL